MDGSYDDEPSPKLGLKEFTEVEKTMTIQWDDITLHCASSSLKSELTHLCSELGEHGIEAEVRLIEETTIEERYGVPDSKCVYLSNGEHGSSTLTYSTEDGSEVNLKIEIWQDSWSNRDLSVRFSMSWTPTRVQKKENIEDMLVNKPLDDMGLVQRHIEKNLSILGWDEEQPEIDCHFTHNTFSKSECAPDIVKRVRDARKAQDATEEE